MLNFKHTLSAIAAVVMVGSLAVRQAEDITSANAENTYGEFKLEQPCILTNDKDESLILLVAVKPIRIEAEEAIKREMEKITDGYIITEDTYLDLKKEPSYEAETVVRLECAAPVIVVGTKGDWYKVNFNDTMGYVEKTKVTKSYEEARVALNNSVKFRTGFINEEDVNIRDNAGTDGTRILDRVGRGTLIFVVEVVNEQWMKVYYGNNYDVGYVMSSYVTVEDAVSKEEVAEAKKKRLNDIAKNGVIASDGGTVNVRKEANENAEIINTLADGASVKIITKGRQWTKILTGENGETAYVSSKYAKTEAEIAKEKKEAERKAAEAKKAQETKQAEKTQEAKNVPERKVSGKSGQAIVDTAAKYIGTKYVYGGNSPSTGFDCSGLVQYVCKQLGISVNRSSKAQYSNGYAVSRDELQAGDLVFFSKGAGISHVVIYAGGGKVIHSPSPGKTVCYTTLSHICSYSNYVGARRVV